MAHETILKDAVESTSFCILSLISQCGCSKIINKFSPTVWTLFIAYGLSW